jgi:hypothetical protein
MAECSSAIERYKELAIMSGDKEESQKLESKASQLIDQSEDDETLDEAAEILAQAERLKGPLDKTRTEGSGDKKTGGKSK